jgi:hypothetical protein
MAGSAIATIPDPGANGSTPQEVTRLTRRIDATETSYASTADLANAMRRVPVARGQHEARTGAADANWPERYAAYMVAGQAGTEVAQ